MGYFAYEFDAPIEIHRIPPYRYRVVWIPADVAARLPFGRSRRLRIDGEVGDVPIRRALMPVRGRWYLLLNPSILKALGATVGDVVDIRFNVASEREVDVPHELAEALRAKPTLQKRWNSLTPGLQRGLSYLVDSAKRGETRARRLAAVLAELREDKPDLRRASSRSRE